MEREQKALELREQTIAGTIGRLFQMLVDIYGTEIKSLDKIKKREGQEVELFFKSLNKSVTMNLSKTVLKSYEGKSDKAVATITLAIPKEDLISTINDLIRTKNNFLGLLKVVFKYILPRKIRIKGSLGAAIKIIKLLSIGTHSMYKN